MVVVVGGGGGLYNSVCSYATAIFKCLYQLSNLLTFLII